MFMMAFTFSPPWCYTLQSEFLTSPSFWVSSLYLVFPTSKSYRRTHRDKRHLFNFLSDNNQQKRVNLVVDTVCFIISEQPLLCIYCFSGWIMSASVVCIEMELEMSLFITQCGCFMPPWVLLYSFLITPVFPDKLYISSFLDPPYISLLFLTHFIISFQSVEDHVAFVITVPTALAIFLAVFVLVCIESIFKKLLRIFSLVIWACLVAMGYLFMFSGGIICPWDQVRYMYSVVSFLCAFCVIIWSFIGLFNMRWQFKVKPLQQIWNGNFKRWIEEIETWVKCKLSRRDVMEVYSLSFLFYFKSAEFSCGECQHLSDFCKR